MKTLPLRCYLADRALLVGVREERISLPTKMETNLIFYRFMKNKTYYKVFFSSFALTLKIKAGLPYLKKGPFSYYLASFPKIWSITLMILNSVPLWAEVDISHGNCKKSHLPLRLVLGVLKLFSAIKIRDWLYVCHLILFCLTPARWVCAGGLWSSALHNVQNHHGSWSRWSWWSFQP